MGAVLFVIPETDLSAVSPEDMSRWKGIEDILTSRSFNVPIYFAFEDGPMRDMVNEMVSTEEARHDWMSMFVETEFWRSLC